MTDKNPMPATDSARDLRNLVHDDVTADFEDDPKFAGSNPSANASSESITVMRDTDDDDDSDDELEDEDDEEFEEDDEDDDDEDIDEADEVGDEEDEEEFDDEEDDDEDEDYEDDEDEVSASPLVLKRAA